jgi:DNA-binding response OmpR family regulator
MSAKILVVDDDPDLLQILRRTLEKTGFDVAIAIDGFHAIEYLKRETPDLAILDVMMPEISGWEVLDFIRNNEATTNVPVLMLTARDQANDVRAGYEYGVKYYLTKPCSTKDLLHGVGVALNRLDLMVGTNENL